MDNEPAPPKSKDYTLSPPHYPKLKNRSQYIFDQEYLKSVSNTPVTPVSRYFISTSTNYININSMGKTDSM